MQSFLRPAVPFGAQFITELTVHGDLPQSCNLPRLDGSPCNFEAQSHQQVLTHTEIYHRAIPVVYRCQRTDHIAPGGQRCGNPTFESWDALQAHHVTWGAQSAYPRVITPPVPILGPAIAPEVPSQMTKLSDFVCTGEANCPRHSVNAPHTLGSQGEAVVRHIGPWPVQLPQALREVGPADALTEWWYRQATEEVDRTVPKAIEYGSQDLVEIGRTMARTAGRTVDDQQAAELGVYFYLVGKVARWTEAVMESREVSDDTLFDIGVYVRMAQRIRSHGGWPGVGGV